MCFFKFARFALGFYLKLGSMLAKRRSLHLNQTSLSDLSAEFCFTKLAARALRPCSAVLYRIVCLVGFIYKFGSNLAKLVGWGYAIIFTEPSGLKKSSTLIVGSVAFLRS